MNLEGKMLGGRYEIIEKIGNGGMATVYKAKCHVLNRFVAVKILRDEFTTDEEFIKRFAAEAQSAASLTHPNIVSVYDVGNEGDLYYIVMELIQGRTLKQIISEDGVLPWKWSVNIAIQVASALETAHKNNIVHRDIKPHNIIITEDGIAKVTDFGIAKAVSNSTITAFGATIGSVHYFSPEHARGGFTDAKSDLYSLGIVMYEMLTGRVPFDADTPVSIALKHMQEKPVEPIKLNPAIPITINKIILKAMQKDTSLRYSSATEMLKDLSLALKNPEGDFVKMKDFSQDFPTQKISIMYDKEIKNDTEETSEKKKKGKIREYFAKHKVLKVLVIVLILILVFSASVSITYYAIESSRPKEVVLPNLVGKTEEEARKMLEELNVIFEIKEEQYNKEVEAGKIISQEPQFKDNYNILEQSTIKVVISKGTEMTQVPKVTGKLKEEAIQDIEDSKLYAEVEEETSAKVQEGYVIKQDLKEDTEVEAGSTVKITVSSGTGIKTVSVPNLIGKTEEEAKKLIKDSGLKLTEVVYEENTTKSQGQVLKQTLDVGKEVDEGTGITITVNKLAEIKQGTVNINLKSITRYKDEKDEVTGQTKPAGKSTVLVKVTSNGTEDTVYKQDHTKDTERITVQIEGIGTVKVKVYIDGVLERQTQLDLNSNNTTWTAE